MQIIPSEVDLSMGTDDEETEKNDSLNSSGERMEETADASDIGTDVKTAGFWFLLKHMLIKDFYKVLLY